MLDYTKVAFAKVVEDFRTLRFVGTLLSQFLYIGYLVYAIIVGAGFLSVNIVLLSVSIAYVVFYVFVVGRKGYGLKSKKKIIRRIFVWLKLLFKAFTLGVTVYGIYAMTTHVTPISIILATLSIIFWVLQVIIEILSVLVESRASLMFEAIKADYEHIKKPFSTVGNIVRRVTGREVESTKEHSPIREHLDALVQKSKEKRKIQNEKKFSEISSDNVIEKSAIEEYDI